MAYEGLVPNEDLMSVVWQWIGSAQSDISQSKVMSKHCWAMALFKVLNAKLCFKWSSWVHRLV